jgi:TnpA family transposase
MGSGSQVPALDTIQRIAVSLAQRKTSQATLVRKLSGYKHNHPLLEALTEYNRLLKTQYLLDYIDDASLRNHVQRALNRGPAASGDQPRQWRPVPRQ